MQSISSSGVTITPDPPVTGAIKYVEFDGSSITFSWEEFHDPHVPDDSDAISHYEWTLFEEDKSLGSTPQHQFFPWIRLAEEDLESKNPNSPVSHVVCIWLFA